MRATSKDWLFVSIQFLLFVLYFVLPSVHFTIPFYLQIAGIIVAAPGCMIALLAVLQLNKNLSPFPSPVQGSSLITNGMYKYVRHPIYTGVILMAVGYAVYSGKLTQVIISVVLVVLFHFKAAYEEQLLMKVFPGYKNYMQHTGRLFPKI